MHSIFINLINLINLINHINHINFINPHKLSKSMEHRFEQIERYLRRQMPAQEAYAFEAEMAADPDLATLVEQHRVERLGLELLVERDLMINMKNWDRETEIFQQLPTRKPVVRPMTWILRAAAVFVVAAFGYWFLQQNTTSTTNTPPPIVQTKPEIKPRVPTVRRPASRPPHRDAPAAVEESNPTLAQHDPGAGNPAPIEEMTGANAPDYAALANDFYRDRDFLPPKGSKGGTAGSASYNQALENFQDGKYNDVVSKIKPNLNLGADALQQKELLALSLYKTGQYEAAIPYFREIIASGKQPFAQRAEWGMALTLLHQMPTKKPLFDRVLAGILDNPQHIFYSQAKRLEGQL